MNEAELRTEWDKLVKNIKKNNSAERLRKIKIIGRDRHE